MANLVRIGFRRILANANPSFANPNQDSLLVRFISSRAMRTTEERPQKPAPWPYQEKRYRRINYLYDKTTPRLDDNSKIVVVEGSVAIGKSKFAKQLAAELDMLYLPEANLDMVYINHYGYDLRKLDDQLSEKCKSFDVMDFLKNPKHVNTARFQLMQYSTKYSQYIDALAHVLSTGQGVVLDRCAYSDFVFVEAMYSHGYLSKAAYKKYYEIRDNTLPEILRPHLVIYLDVPVPQIIENIKKRGLSYEKNSSVLTPKYLQEIEKQYKQNYLKEINNHAELLVYDWSEPGDVEIVVEDIERIKFEYDYQDTKMQDWKMEFEEDWSYARHEYSDKKDRIMQYFNIPCYDVPELIVDGMEYNHYIDVMNSAPGEKYEIGYNAELGDDNLLFKGKTPHRDTLPLRERRTSL